MRTIISLLIISFIAIHTAASEFSVTEPPKNLGTPVNSPRNDFAPTLTPDGRCMIFNSNRDGRYQNLYISCLKEGKWSTPEAITGLNSPHNDESPFLSRDGNILIFSSDRDGSTEMPIDEQNRIRVSFDLYWSQLVNGEWTKPQPVPGEVNGIHHVKSPSLSDDGRTLYYNMWPFGDLTRAILVRAELKEGRFINPELMPAPFNQGYSDLGLIPAEDLGGFFFSSNRPGNTGTFDLYFVKYENGEFEKPQNLGRKINSAAADVYLARADQRYFITSSREKGRFDIYSSHIFTSDRSFETRAIHFDFDKADIKPESFEYLDALCKHLNENPGIKLEIIGHTDLHGEKKYNKDLSLRRARAVKEYLVKQELDSERFQVSGAGSERPVIESTGPGIDELNRRTEFQIIE